MPKLTIPVPLRWGDMDALGHVNNATAVQLLEQARIEAFFGPGRPVRNVVVARNEIEYLVPIPYTHEPLRADTWIARIGGASVDIHYELRSPEGPPEILHAKAATVVVFLDPSGAPRRLTDEERAEWAAYVDEPVQFRRS